MRKKSAVPTLIALAPLVLRAWQIPVLTAVAAAALWGQGALRGMGRDAHALSVETAFLAAAGALTFWASERAARRERDLRADADRLQLRMEQLARELEDAQTVSHLGEHVARLAHSTKSSLHSLRGFAKLIEGPLLEHPAQRRALDGMRLAIDQLEEIARRAMRPSAPGPAVAHGTPAANVHETLAAIVDELGPLHPDIRWSLCGAARARGVSLPPEQLREVLLAVVRNAIEACEASGEIAIHVDVIEGMVKLTVRDHGPGLSPSAKLRLFRVGATTKPTGNGLGLFLARHLVESRGGRITAESADDGGAMFAVNLPIQEC